MTTDRLLIGQRAELQLDRALQVLESRGLGRGITEEQHRYAADGLQGAGNPRHRTCPRDKNDLADASCDAAISIEWLPNVSDNPAFFGEVQRVSRSVAGGR